MATKLDRLNTDYLKNVLPHLVPNARNRQLYFKTTGLVNDLYSVELQHNSFVGKGGMYDPKVKSFVHFTDLRALYSIINYGSLRLYNLNNLNDPSEFTYNLGDIKKVNEKVISAYRENTFVLSMSKPDTLNLGNDNSLNMWRLYGRDGSGVAIELEIEDLNVAMPFFLGEVKYQKLDLKRFLHENEAFEVRHNVKTNYTKALLVPASLQKNKAYKIENEIRLVHQPEIANPYPWKNTSRYDTSPYFPDIPKSPANNVYYYSLPVDTRVNSDYLGFWSMPKVRIKSIQLGFKINGSYADNVSNEFKKMYNYLIGNDWLSKKEIPKITKSPLVNIYQ